jgi:hypothetical protein
MEQASASDHQTAADIAIAVQHGDREALIAAALSHPAAQGLEREVIEEWADMMMRDADA